ncbi:hypothetical protein B6S12_03290 [Helicobacter valdiviensis]|uniref:ABC-type transport auxiliary lipoprotein component domain-containing protein n=1 Tax=Helicobacter valdiviensis TaxID=1458358 RepID=A0A2W6MX73_9HELI|nr:hypothetical protein [Helicobacter valdiviensis]PZT48511.1 hypothetical protein B6S12_03290 [Helicobacter valdiviensis]
MLKILRYFFVILVVFVLSGCVGREVPAKNYYELKGEFGGEGKLKTPMELEFTLSVPNKLDTKKIAYKNETKKEIEIKSMQNEQNPQLKYFAKNEWVGNTKEILEDYFIQVALEKNNILLKKSAKNTKGKIHLKVMDMYYSHNDESVKFRALGFFSIKEGVNIVYIISESEKVGKEYGDFRDIPEAFSRLLDKALSDFLQELQKSDLR